MADEITMLRAQLAQEKAKAARLEQTLKQKNPQRASLFLEGNFGTSMSDDEPPNESAVKDVLANLAAISRAKGLLDVPDGGTDTELAEATTAIPEDAKVLGRTLGRSVRKGQLNAHRALAAARWVDKEIRKVIALIKEHGTQTDGTYTVTFGTLFDVAADVMEAVSGTLNTAKKKGVVAFEGEILFQGLSDNVTVTLLKESIPDSNVDTYTYRQVRACSINRGPKGPRKGKAFGQASAQGDNAKCAVCTKTIYAMEYTGVAGRPLHKSCFRCSVCKGKLREDNFATAGNVLYCKTHYEEAFKKAGGYNFGTPASSGKDERRTSLIALDKEVSTDEPLSNIESLLDKVAVDEAAATRGADGIPNRDVEDAEVEDDDSDLDVDASSDEEEGVAAGASASTGGQVATATATAAPASASSTSTPHHAPATGTESESKSKPEAAAVTAGPTPTTASTNTSKPPQSASSGFARRKRGLSTKKLGASVRHGHVDKASAMQAVEWVDQEIRRLVSAIVSFGDKNNQGQWQTTYRQLNEGFNDKFQSLSGTLRTCKKQNIVDFGPRFLMKGPHDAETITLLQESPPPATLNTYSVKQIRQVSGRGFGGLAAPRPPAAQAVKAPQVGLMVLSPPPETPSPDTPTVSPPSASTTEKASAASTSKDGAGADNTHASSPYKKKPKFSSIWSPWKKKNKGTGSSTNVTSSDTPTTTTQGTANPTATATARTHPSAPPPAAVTTTTAPAITVREDDDVGAVEDVIATMVVIASPDDDSEEDSGAGGSPAGDGGGGGGGDAEDNEERNPIKRAALRVDEGTKVLGRSLGASVRRGELRQERALAAARWVDKEIRKVIALIKEHGTQTDGTYTVTFGTLFDVAADVMEAVSGTLKTAKKKGVVAFDAEILFQGMSDGVVIKLLKHDIPDSNVDTYTYRQVRACSINKGPKRGKAFGEGTLQGSNSKCAVCDKTVYAMEYIGISGKGLHKNCFRCTVCKNQLRQDNYATMDERFFCKTHYEEAFKSGGGSYNF